MKTKKLSIADFKVNQLNNNQKKNINGGDDADEYLTFVFNPVTGTTEVVINYYTGPAGGNGNGNPAGSGRRGK